jgi:hypothetical protein
MKTRSDFSKKVLVIFYEYPTILTSLILYSVGLFLAYFLIPDVLFSRVSHTNYIMIFILTLGLSLSVFMFLVIIFSAVLAFTWDNKYDFQLNLSDELAVVRLKDRISFFVLWKMFFVGLFRVFTTTLYYIFCYPIKKMIGSRKK